jgi:hypothetical protein
MRKIFQKLFGRSPSLEQAAPQQKAPRFDQEADLPESFGYKVSWFAIKTSNPVSVLDAFAFGEATASNWSSGLAAAYGGERGDDRWVFVSPPVGGWVLAISRVWPYPTVQTHHDIGVRFHRVFSRLIERFDDVQFFGSYRVSDFTAWGRALDGKPSRLFAWGDGEVLMNDGNQTLEEAVLGLVDVSGLSPLDAGNEIFRLAEAQNEEEERLIAGGLSHNEAHAQIQNKARRIFPAEDDVTDLAALWSIDPSLLSEQDHPPGLGWAVRLPDDLGQ